MLVKTGRNGAGCYTAGLSAPDLPPEGSRRLRVCAVSYLNTAPLVWGLLHGPQRAIFDLSFAVPAVLSDRLATGEVDIGIVPCAELDRLGLDFLPDVGIACRGAVRSILLISKLPPGRIRTLAADMSSRSSVMLSRIVLYERYGARPEVVSMPPVLDQMLARADAALIIGDPALHLDPASLPWRVLDLGAEWWDLTGLPMVFAVWAARPGILTSEIGEVFRSSWIYGDAHLSEIVDEAGAQRGVAPGLAYEYLTRCIHFELGPAELEGLALYRSRVAELRTMDAMPVPAH